MPTNNPRVNITLEPKLLDAVNSLAKKEHKSVAGLSKELIIEALERREDYALSALANERDTKKTKKVSHHAAWE